MSTMNCPRAVSLRPFLACYSLPRHEREGPRAGIAGMAAGTRERERRAISRANRRRSSGRASARPVAGPRAAGPRAAGPRAAGPRAAGPRAAGPRAAGPGQQNPAAGPSTTRRSGTSHRGPARGGTAQRTTPHRPVQCRTARCRTAQFRTAQTRTAQTRTAQTRTTQYGATHPAVRRRSEPGLGDHQLPGGRHGGLRGHRLAYFLVDRPFRGACAHRAACRAWSRAHDDCPPLWQVLTCPLRPDRRGARRSPPGWAGPAGPGRPRGRPTEAPAVLEPWGRPTEDPVVLARGRPPDVARASR